MKKFAAFSLLCCLFQFKIFSQVVSGPSLVCPGAEVPYTFSPTNWNTWDVTAPGATINGIAPPVTLQGLPVFIKFGAASGEVCAHAFAIDPPQPPFVCKYVAVQPLPPTQLPPLQIFDLDLPYFWVDDQTLLTQVGTFNLSATFVSQFGCDSIVKQTVTVLKHPGYPVQGKAFLDKNFDFVQNPDEPLAAGIVTILKNGTPRATQTTQGNFSVQMFEQEELTFMPLAPDANVFPSFYQFSLAQQQNFDFVVQAEDIPGNGGVPNWQVSMDNLQVFRPGFQTEIRIHVGNLNQPQATQVKLVLPNNLQVVGATPAIFSTLGDSLFWQISPATTGNQDIFLKVKTDLGAAIGSSVSLAATVNSVAGETVLQDNFVQITRQIFGSFDPNMKEVSSNFLTNNKLASGQEELEYVVHFQNLGNFPADFVIVSDTLGDFFDLSSLKILSASHDFQQQISGKILRFNFQNIQLPPASVDERGSQGFVKFKIKPLSNLPAGTLISNSADIVFDFNLPIRTNAAETWVSFVPTSDLDFLYAKPNPASQWIKFSWKHPAPQTGIFRLIDSNGFLKSSFSIEKGGQFLDVLVAELPSGIYWGILEIGSRRYVRQVVVERSSGGIRRD